MCLELSTLVIVDVLLLNFSNFKVVTRFEKLLIYGCAEQFDPALEFDEIR